MKVFITGITGTLGSALAELHLARGDKVYGCGRSESKGVEWQKAHPAARLFVGQAGNLAVRDSECRLHLYGCDRVYHLAALKHVDVCERQPWEATRNNVDLTQAVATVCEQTGIPLVFASTDKACLPEGVYGSTKLIGERIVLARGGAAVRLGNLIGSSGSVFRTWWSQTEANEPITLTDPTMTRYFIPVAAAALFMADRALPGRVAAPVMKAATMGAVALQLAGGNVRIVGLRPGETQHQWLAAPQEPVTACKERIVLGEGVPTAAGLCSAWAQPWDVAELLQHAGVTG